MADEDDRLLTTDDACAWLGVSRHTMEVWRVQGQGPAFVKLGERLVRYRRADLLAFVEARMRSNTAGGLANPA